jgi:hypothetical protein
MTISRPWSEVYEVDADRQAAALLEALRETPMRRGGMSGPKRTLQRAVSLAIEERGVPPRLARRVGGQLVLKFDATQLGNRATWSAIGQRLQGEAERLTTRVGLIERQIIAALPKLSVGQIEHFLEELRAVDAKIARTILNAALNAAEPLPAGRRFAEGFRQVAEQLKELDPRLARTLANATFMARIPHEKAIEHFRQFARLIATFQGDVGFLRTVARAAFRTPDPIRAARQSIAIYRALVAELMGTGVESDVARYLAAIASVRADPVPTAHRLERWFADIFRSALKTHPSVARSIALNACRATDPVRAAQRYMDRYTRNHPRDRLSRSEARTSSGRLDRATYAAPGRAAGRSR